MLTAKNARPSTSWLEIVKTARAKHHIRRWIKSTQMEESVRLGREILERELHRRKLHVDLDRELAKLASEFGYSETDRLVAAARRFWNVPASLDILPAPGASALIARLPALLGPSGSCNIARISASPASSRRSRLRHRK